MKNIIENPEIRKLCRKVHKKMREFEKDESQICGAVNLAYKANNNPKKTLSELYDYLCNPQTSKTRNDIGKFILERHTEFQKRTKANILKNAEKITF